MQVTLDNISYYNIDVMTVAVGMLMAYLTSLQTRTTKLN